MFSTPAKFYKGEVKNYSEFKEQNDRFIEKTDPLTNQIVTLKELESKSYSTPSPEIENSIKQLRESLTNGYVKLSEDTTALTAFNLSRSLKNYLAACDAILFYCTNGIATRQNISTLNNSINKLSKGDTEGLLKDLNKCHEDKANLSAQIAVLTKDLAKANNRPSVNAPANNDEVNKLNRTIDDTQKERDNYKNLLNQKTQEYNQKVEELKRVTDTKGTSTPVPVYICNDEEKAKILFQKGNYLYKIGMGQKKDLKTGYLRAAIEILKGTEDANPESRNLIKKINKELAPELVL